MENFQKNILITTAPFGNGHKMVASALKKAFIKKGYNNIYVIDLFTEAHPIFTETIRQAYLKSYNYGYAYSFLFYGVEKIADKKIIDVYRRFGYKTLKNLVSLIEPDIIINTFPILATERIKSKLGKDIPILTIITDFYMHKLWVSEEIDRFYIATDEIKKELEKMNVPVEKAIVSGIPIRDAFEDYENIGNLYKKYNLNNKKRLVLISAGAFGVLRNIDKICISLCNNKNTQVAVVCGNNEKLKNKLLSINIPNLKIFGFIENIHELYKLATCMITKSGGITLSEALAVQLPLVLYKPFPGQEKENAIYFQTKGAAIIANNTTELIKYTKYIVSNPEVAIKMKKNMLKLYNKSSSNTIVDDVINCLNNE